MEGLTSDEILGMDITELAEFVTEGHTLYKLTEEERKALLWIGDRYKVSTVLIDSMWEPHGLLGGVLIDPLDVSEALAADGLDRIPCLSEDTALARIVWAIGPNL